MSRSSVRWTSRAVVAAMLGFGVAAAIQSEGAAVVRQDSRPNILLIQADDLGYGDLGSYGQKRFETPALDRLAREGIRFTHYYAGSTVCAPSRAALMTGLHTGHAWIRGNGEVPLRPEDVTLAEVLRSAGYRTAVIGKWGLGEQGTTGLPGLQGFDRAFGFLNHRHAHRQFTDHLYRDGTRVELDETRDYANDRFTEEAVAFMLDADARPFFAYLNYTAPHPELRVPEDSLAVFRGRYPERPYTNETADARPGPWVPGGPSLGYRSQAEPHAAYAAMIARLDRDVGRLVELVDQQGLGRRTLVLFTSDNGPHREGGGDPAFFASSGGLRGIKRDLYEGGIRVPMIARWTDRVPSRQESDHPWAHWDLLPTLADVAGAEVPAGLDGMSMREALLGRSQATHRFFYWEFHERGFQQAVRMGRWKAVRSAKDAPLELYDLNQDPTEGHDVASVNPAVVAEIEAYLEVARTESERWPVK